MRRTLSDDTLVVFLSDCHIGGDEGRDIFETPDDLATLFDALHDHPGPVELILAGDFFDLLRLGKFSADQNRVSVTIGRPEYLGLMASLRRLAAGNNRRVVYLPGNHDAEVWWNPELRAELSHQGLVHEFALSYAASFRTDPDSVVYCEHGNQFDPANTINDYDDPLDTPLGSHIVTDLMPRLPRGRATSALHLRDIDRIFPLTTIPEWVTGKLFYEFVTKYFQWLLVPFVVASVAYDLIDHGLGGGGEAVGSLIGEIGSDVLLLSVFALFLFVARRMANRALHSAAVVDLHGAASRSESVDATVEKIRRRLEDDLTLPMRGDFEGEISVFVSGHSHAPSLNRYDARSGSHGALVNSGCWLRQLHPVRAHLGAPTVFVSEFVQTHVRVRRDRDGIKVELWEHPRPSPMRLRVAERLAVAGRLPAQPDDNSSPRVRASTLVERAPISARVDGATPPQLDRDGGGHNA